MEGPHHKWCDKKNLGIRLEIDTTIPGVFFGRSVRVWCSKAKRAHPDLSLGMHYFCTPSHSCSVGSSVTPETGTTAAGPRTEQGWQARSKCSSPRSFPSHLNRSHSIGNAALAALEPGFGTYRPLFCFFGDGGGLYRPMCRHLCCSSPD